jgi:hypothetical protein
LSGQEYIKAVVGVPWNGIDAEIEHIGIYEKDPWEGV